MDDKNSKSAAEKKAERSSVIEDQINEAQKRKDERLFLEELAKRITVAREGKHFSDKKDFSKAIVCYRKYLSVTARSVGVEEASLQPKLFEEKTRHSESLLLSSIVFDMLKILDKLDTPTAKDERKILHKLFIRFTIDQPFQNFAAENMRKYLSYRKTIRNRSEFWATYHAIRMKKFCAVASWAFSPTSPETAHLREFRDRRLAVTAPGRAFIAFYYRNGGALVRGLSYVPGSRTAARAALSVFVKLLAKN